MSTSAAGRDPLQAWTLVLRLERRPTENELAKIDFLVNQIVPKIHDARAAGASISHPEDAAEVRLPGPAPANRLPEIGSPGHRPGLSRYGVTPGPQSESPTDSSGILHSDINRPLTMAELLALPAGSAKRRIMFDGLGIRRNPSGLPRSAGDRVAHGHGETPHISPPPLCNVHPRLRAGAGRPAAPPIFLVLAGLGVGVAIGYILLSKFHG